MRQYRFAVSYNIFDNFELLPASIAQIRDSVDFISVVYQTKSNYGNDADKNLVPFLQQLVDNKLVDKIVEFVPKHFGDSWCHRNEHTKRELGQQLSHFAGCTNHLCADSDEFFEKDKFKSSLQKIVDNDFDCTFSHIQDYGTSPTRQTIGLADYFVPFFYKITGRLVLGFKTYRYSDPCRSTSDYVRPYQFTSDELLMHHMTKFRDGEKGLQIKYENSSARQNFLSIPNMIKQSYVDNEDDAKYITVEDKFNILNVFNK